MAQKSQQFTTYDRNESVQEKPHGELYQEKSMMQNSAGTIEANS